MSTEGSCGFNSVPGLNSSLKINNNTQIVIQNNSDEISISKESNSEEVLGNSKSSVPLKAQMLPVVYIKNNNVKIPFAATKTPTNNFIISPTTSSVFLSKPNNSISTISFNKQNVLIAGKGRNLVMPKSVMEHRPQKRTKVDRTTTYVTMLKPIVGKPISSAGVGIHQHHHLQNEEIKLTGVPPHQSSSTTAIKQPQKFILTGSIPMAKITTNSNNNNNNNNNNNKMPPMPKVQTNRPSATVTTNCLQAGKFALLPMPVPSKDQIIANNNNSSHQQMINFQISDGKIISSKLPSNTVFLSSDTNNVTVVAAPVLTTTENSSEILLNDDDELNNCDAMTEKNDVSSKSYELSIAEEESSSNQSDNTNKLVVSSSSADSNSSVEMNLVANNNHKPNNTNNNAVKFAHGISILKKNYVAINTTTIPEGKKTECVQIEDMNIIDDAKIIIPPSNSVVEEKIVHTIVPELSVKKPEKEKLNRRKSQFSLRKDFDEHDITFPPDTKLPEIIEEELIVKEIKVENVVDDADEVNIKDEIDIGDIKCEEQQQVIEEPPFDPKTLLKITPTEEEVYKCLTWEDNVGRLPGSDLKFIQNEFGIIEYLSEGDYLKIMDKKSRKVQEKLDMEREVQCLVCSCYGIRADFIAHNYCSLDCQRFSKKISMKKQLQPHSYNKPAKKPRLSKTKSENDIIKEFNKEIEIGEDETSNDASQDKYSYPWECKKKGFLWSKYLLHTNTRAAPVKLFKEPFPYNRNGFKPGMKLEGVDPQHPSYFCVLTVTEILGYRIRLHFDGYPDSYDFWTYGDSPDIFPIGWCEKYGHELHPPPGYKTNDFNWLNYLKATKSTAAPKHLFVNRAGQAICPNGFRIGMKLEAVDKKNNSALICVATIRDMMDNRILVHFDGWDDIYDYWVDPTSPYIHPVGWSDQYGHDLTPPSDYSTPETFTWEIYLKETKSVAAPVRAFKQRPACGFKRGMRLECVDKRVPHIIRVATVDDVREHQIKILFDGWPNKYSYWVDDDCPDIHPIGWCQKTGHPLEPPLTPDDVYDFLECPTIGCRGLGHTNKMKYSSHSVPKYCPYSDANLEMDRTLPDRLLSPEKIPEVKEPLPIQPSLKEFKTKPRLGKVLKTTNNKRIKRLSSEKQPKKRAQVRKIKQEDEDETSSLSLDQHTVEEKAQLLIDDIKIGPAERESWKHHSRFLNEFIGLSECPQDWSPEQVFEFISDIPGCSTNAPCIIEHKIDGEALLQLNQFDILNILKFKVGPAIKLYNSIVILREKNCDKNFE